MADKPTDDILAEYEELFAQRYTDDDAEFMKTVNKTSSPPPCVPDWLNAGYSRGNQGRDDRRDRNSQGQGRYGGDRYHPYQRNERQGGDRHGNRPHDRYNDRSRYDRKKPATEYGSQGYFQYYY